MIYYIANISARAIKVGYTGPDSITRFGAQNRLNSLQSGNADTLYLLAVEDGNKIKEKSRQEQFGHLCIRGEWFYATKELLDHIEGLGHVVGLEIISALRINNDIKEQNRILRHASEKAICATKQMAEKGANEIIEDARKKAFEITQRALNGETVSAAREEAKRIIEMAQKKAQKSAQIASSEITGFARKEADRIVKAARKKADGIIKAAQKEAEGLSSLGKYRFDCRCNHCGMPNDTVCERTDGLSWCDSCWDKLEFAEIAAKARELGHGKAMRY